MLYAITTEMQINLLLGIQLLILSHIFPFTELSSSNTKKINNK